MFPTRPEQFAPPPRSRFHALRTLRTFAAVLGVSWALAALGAHTPAADPTVPDVLLARSALDALDADPVFRDVNLLVSVVDGVAVVGGSVPTREVGERAGQTIRRRVTGIKDVRNLCFVQAGPDPLIRAMASATPAAPRRNPATGLPLPAVVASPKTGAVDNFAVFPEENALAAADPHDKTVVVRKPTKPGDSVLLPPVSSAGVAPAVPSPVVAPAVPPVTLTSRPADVQAAAEAARRSDRRFAGLTVQLRDGILVIGGTAARMSDAWDYADKLRVIPGVARVAIGQVAVR